jgi:hypothetical protein
MTSGIIFLPVRGKLPAKYFPSYLLRSIPLSQQVGRGVGVTVPYCIICRAT